MDRNEALREAKALAAQMVADLGTIGGPQPFMRGAAEHRYDAFLGSHELLRVWREAAGLDSKTGAPPRAKDEWAPGQYVGENDYPNRVDTTHQEPAPPGAGVDPWSPGRQVGQNDYEEA